MWPIITKRKPCRMDLKFGGPPEKFCGTRLSNFRRNFGQFRHFIANVSEAQLSSFVSQKTALQTAITAACANFLAVLYQVSIQQASTSTSTSTSGPSTSTSVPVLGMQVQVQVPVLS